MRALPSVVACLSLSACVAVGGCALPAWIAAQFAPPEKVEPEFEPPADKRMLVFVDDMIRPVTYPAIKAELTGQINQRLLAHDIAADTVSYDELANLIAASPDFNALPVATVGRKLDADLVLYVQIDEFALRDEQAPEDLWRGRLRTTVRMVDVEQGRLWPKNRSDGHLMPLVETPTSTEDSPSMADELTKRLAATMAEDITRLFREHTRPHEGGWQDKSPKAP